MNQHEPLPPYPLAQSFIIYNGAMYTPAQWDLRCRLEKIEAQLARVIKNQESADAGTKRSVDQ